MSNLLHDFLFDVNFGCASESVFTLVDLVELSPVPPLETEVVLHENESLEK